VEELRSGALLPVFDDFRVEAATLNAFYRRSPGLPAKLRMQSSISPNNMAANRPGNSACSTLARTFAASSTGRHVQRKSREENRNDHALSSRIVGLRRQGPHRAGGKVAYLGYHRIRRDLRISGRGFSDPAAQARVELIAAQDVGWEERRGLSYPVPEQLTFAILVTKRCFHEMRCA
jgi:hypothetical protein